MMKVARPRRRPHDNGGRKLNAKESRRGLAWAALSRLIGLRPRRWRAFLAEAERGAEEAWELAGEMPL